MTIFAIAMILFCYLLIYVTFTGNISYTNRRDENPTVDEDKECSQVREIIKNTGNIQDMVLYNHIHKLRSKAYRAGDNIKNNIYIKIEENENNDRIINLIGESFRTKVSRMSELNEGSYEYPIDKGYLINGMDNDIRNFFYSDDNK